MTMTSKQWGLVRSLNVKRVTCAALYPLAALLVFAGNVMVPGGYYGAAFAQEEKKEDDDRMSGRRTQALSKPVYDLMTDGIKGGEV